MNRVGRGILVSAFVGGCMALVSGCDTERRGEIPLRDAGHPVLLLVDADAIASVGAADIARRWFDLEWANVLGQGYGGCDIASTSTGIPTLEDRELLVLPRRTAAALDRELLDALEEQVERGLEVLVEAPDSSLARRLGLELSAVERRPSLPWPTPVATGARRTLSLRPQPVPVPWTRFRYAPRPAPPDQRPRVHLSLDGRPMGWSIRHGDGAWIVLGVDFAELTARLRTGEAGLPAGADEAWLDAWVEGLCGSALTTLPLPRVATVPPTVDGWLVVQTPADSLQPQAPTPRTGWDRGTGLPARALLRDGTLSADVIVPPVYAGPASGFDPVRLDRWARLNATGGASALVLHFTDTVSDSLRARIDSVAGLRDHRVVSRSGLAGWWEQRSGVVVHVQAGEESVDYRILSVPEGPPPYGLLIPVRWRNRSLEGWDADWGFVAGRRIDRFDRSYRLVTLDPAAAGGTLKLRYR